MSLRIRSVISPDQKNNRSDGHAPGNDEIKAMIARTRSTAAGRATFAMAQTTLYARAAPGCFTMLKDVGVAFSLDGFDTGASSYELFLIVFDDLSFILTEHGEISDYDYPTDANLATFHDAPLQFRDLLGATSNVCAMTNGMRALLGVPNIEASAFPDHNKNSFYSHHDVFEPEPGDHEIAALEAIGGGADAAHALLQSLVYALIESVPDQFIVPESTKSWDEDEEADAARILRMALITDTRLMSQDDAFTTDVFFVAQGPDGNATELRFDNGDEIGDEAMAETALRVEEIMDQILGVSDWIGSAYEYNDGAPGRASGYSESSPTIAQICEFNVGGAASAHERLSTACDLINILVVGGLSEQDARGLVMT